MTTMRAVSIGFAVWFFALFLFFFVLGGMGLFHRDVAQQPIKRAAAEDTFDAAGMSDEMSSGQAAWEEAERMNRQSSAEFRRWARQGPQGSSSSVTRPTSVEGMRPEPMTDLSSY